MRLPWNRKYMEIGFHIIVTVLILVVTVGLLFWLPHAKIVISETAGNILAVFRPFYGQFSFLCCWSLLCVSGRGFMKNAAVFFIAVRFTTAEWEQPLPMAL